ncbi:MAG: hypothetical protein WC128_00845 [Bacteroidales bacterium]|jgi:hypothetical protein
MKRYHAILLMVVPGMIISGCTGLFGWKNYEGSEQFREDVAVFAEYAVQKQFLTLYYLKATSDNFSRNMLKGTVSREEYDVFFGKVAEMAPHVKEYEAAFKNLEKSGILTSVNTKGILSSGTKFLSWVTGSGERSRERVLKVASNIPPSDRTELYNKLRPEWKAKTSGESDFWKKMEKGDFDYQAPQMFNDFQQDNEEFGNTSVERGLTIQKIFVAEGAKGVEAGAELMVDALQTTTSGGLDAADVGDMTLDIYNSSSNADPSQIAQELSSTVNGMDPDDPTVKEMGAGYAAKMAAIMKEIVDVAKTDTENTPGTNRSFVFVQDEDTENKADIVIAQNPGNSSASMASIYVTIGNIIDEGQKFIYTILNKGKWLISAVDSDGNKSTKEVDVPAGDVLVVTLTTSPPAKESEEETEDDFTDWNALVAQYPVLNAYPAFSGSLTYLEYTTDSMFYEAIKIRANTSDVDKYINTIKGKGYKKEEDKEIISYMSPNRIGDYWRYVQLFASGVSGKTDVRFFNLK